MARETDVYGKPRCTSVLRQTDAKGKKRSWRCESGVGHKGMHYSQPGGRRWYG